MVYMMNETESAKMKSLENASMYQLSNLIYFTLVESGSDRNYADSASDFAELQGREFCLEMLQNLGYKGE